MGKLQLRLFKQNWECGIIRSCDILFVFWERVHSYCFILEVDGESQVQACYVKY